MVESNQLEGFVTVNFGKGAPRINRPLLLSPKISIIEDSVQQTLEKAGPEKNAITFSSRNNH